MGKTEFVGAPEIFISAVSDTVKQVRSIPQVEGTCINSGFNDLLRNLNIILRLKFILKRAFSMEKMVGSCIKISKSAPILIPRTRFDGSFKLCRLTYAG